MSPTKTPENDEIGEVELSDQELIANLSAELSSDHTGEAMGIAWTELWGLAKDPKSGEQKMVRINLTSRSYVGPRQALENLMDALTMAKEDLHMRPYQPSYQTSQPPASKPAEAVPAGQPAQTGKTPAAGKAPTAPKPEGEKEKGGELVVRCVKMDTVPEAEGKVTLKFFAPGHQYPDLSVNKWAMENVIKLLTPVGAWDEFYLNHADHYDVDLDVHYVLSDKVNTKGVPYKNVTAVTPAGA